MNQGLRALAQEPAGQSTADPVPRAPSPPPRPRRVDQSSASVSTALTSMGLTSIRPARIIVILRFHPGMHRRCGADVSVTDTDTPPIRIHGPTVASGAASLSRCPTRGSVSEVMTPACLRSEEAAQYLPPSNARHKVRQQRANEHRRLEEQLLEAQSTVWSPPTTYAPPLNQMQLPRLSYLFLCHELSCLCCLVVEGRSE